MKTRKFTRHLTDIPFSFVINNIIGEQQLYMENISQGGLCFNAHACIDRDTHLDIKIPFASQSCKISGKIAWCRPTDTGQCLLGIMFQKQVKQSDIEKMIHRH